ncbi:uncharacterized protein LOC127802706 [Diospyros lotus]|uniref:uncharacterized protein LOC127802706 n=1 Tax=Diospyros lotus TaxID=55363 RepID=UPI002258F275|nr:uncharacterized protein LOC127802706 [Diospyros lotus]
MGTPIATAGGGGCRHVVVELPLGNAAATFDLEKAVCSHGLFMMAPNQWDSQSKTLTRPLRLDPGDYCGNGGSVLVRISQPSQSPRSVLHLSVLDADSLSLQHQQSLLAQVRRMLRLSEMEEEIVKEFQEMHGEAKERGFGRVFRSPTLFEDMVKCILLCNCQWSRTLSMARDLCELQLELQCPAFGVSFDKVDDGANLRNPTVVTEHFTPKTPAGKDSKKKIGGKRHPSNLVTRFWNTRAQMEVENETNTGSADCSQETAKLSPSSAEEDLPHCCNAHQTTSEICKAYSTEIDRPNSCLLSDLQSSEGVDSLSSTRIGNFPSPRELASLDEKFLAKRCSLGYRAGRILKLAQGIVEGRVQLRQLEEACGETSLSNYSKLDEQLKQIDGFGPFTCANVLMCMGFYHVIPVDSETIRHLKQVHVRNSTPQKVQRDIDKIYGKYKPFQFLAYWSEVWHFYEEWFGKLSEMPPANYKLITAANMKRRTPKSKEKRNKMRHGNSAQTKRTKYLNRESPI